MPILFLLNNSEYQKYPDIFGKALIKNLTNRDFPDQIVNLTH